MFPREHLTMPGDIFDCRKVDGGGGGGWGVGWCYWHLVGGQECCRHPTLHRTIPLNKELSSTDVNIFKVENLVLVGFLLYQESF